MEHASKKSYFYVLMLGGIPAYVDDPGVSHADELMYLWNSQIPLIMCDLPPMISKRQKDCIIQ